MYQFVAPGYSGPSFSGIEIRTHFAFVCPSHGTEMFSDFPEDPSASTNIVCLPFFLTTGHMSWAYTDGLGGSCPCQRA